MLFASLKHAPQILRHENPEMENELEEKSFTAIHFDNICRINSLARRQPDCGV